MGTFATANVPTLNKIQCVRWPVYLLLLLMLIISFAYGQNGYALPQKVLFLTRVNRPLDQEWEHETFVKKTRYTLVKEEGRPAIRAVGQESSSGLYKKVKYSLKKYPWLEWEWKLVKAQKTADLRIKEKEDMALGIFIIFPHAWLMPWKTKAIAYVWTGAKHKAGQILMHPHHPYFVLEAGEKKKGRWIRERRNVYEDYKRVWGAYPIKDAKAIGLFTDNDQTKEPVIGFYGPVRATTD